MSEAKLSPCPFCGNQVESNIAYTASMINCDNQDCIMIGCLIDNEPFLDEIEKRWNESSANKEIQKRDELLNTALKHLDMAYKWGLWLYESEDYQEMEDDDEKDNMGSDLDIVCSFLNTNKGSER